MNFVIKFEIQKNSTAAKYTQNEYTLSPSQKVQTVTVTSDGMNGQLDDAETVSLKKMLENDLQDEVSFPQNEKPRQTTAAALGYGKEFGTIMTNPISFRQSIKPGVLTKEKFIFYINNADQYDEFGLLPIHKICAQFPEHSKLIATMIRSNPFTAKMPVNLIKPVKASLNESGFSNEIKRIDLVDSTFHYINERIGGVSNPSFCYQPGQYPLHIAVANKASPESAKVLIKAAPHVLQMRDKNGMTPLMLMFRFYRTLNQFHDVDDSIILMLLHAPQTVFSTDLRSNNPLHYACIGGCSLDIVKYITKLNPGAVNERNFDGLTPLELAQQQVNKIDDEVIAYLQSIAYPEEEMEDAPDI